MMAYYLDTSAFLKLIVAEKHSKALRTWAARQDQSLVSSDLLRIESLRAARRLGPEVLLVTRKMLRAVHLISLTADICESAAELNPAILRSLDAAHLATALQLGVDLEGIVTYDERMSEAAAQLGVRVLAPGITREGR
jgi:predicted nucleic acid-binding protein